MSEQIDRQHLRSRARLAEQDDTAVLLAPRELNALLDRLGPAEEREVSDHDHGLADYCQHESVGRMCDACRRLANEAARQALTAMYDDTMKAANSETARVRIQRMLEVAGRVRVFRDANYPKEATDGR